MNFGFSLGDFVILSQIAWNLYKACKDAPEEFKNVSQEVLSLHAVLKEVEETYSDVTISAAQQSRLKIFEDGCRGVLEDLQKILDKYNSLGSNTKRTWDRLGWGSKDIAKLRSRLTSNTVLLTTFLNTSQVVIQKKLDTFLQEFRDGKHEGSIVSAQTVDSLSTDERQAWRAIRKELEDIGISIAAFDANKDFIVNWFKTAISTGAFEEQVEDALQDASKDGSNSILRGEDPSQSLEHPGDDTVLSHPLEDLGHDTEILPYTTVNLQTRKSKIENQRLPRVVGLINWLLRYNKDLFKAVQSKDEMKILQLLEKGVDINVKGDNGHTPLHHAVSIKSEVMVQFLLQNGADVHATTKLKGTALGLAAKSGHETMVELLLKNGADIHAKNHSGQMALGLAAEYGNVTMVELLLKNGADIHAKNHRGQTALGLAAAFGYETMVELLLKNGADIHAKNDFGHTALHKAAAFGRETLVTLFLNRGANIHAKSDGGNTALHLATFNGHERLVPFLLKGGAEVDVKNHKGKTALEQSWDEYTARNVELGPMPYSGIGNIGQAFLDYYSNKRD